VVMKRVRGLVLRAERTMVRETAARGLVVLMLVGLFCLEGREIFEIREGRIIIKERARICQAMRGRRAVTQSKRVGPPPLNQHDTAVVVLTEHHEDVNLLVMFYCRYCCITISSSDGVLAN
jgi:hypothetical protein